MLLSMAIVAVDSLKTITKEWRPKKRHWRKKVKCLRLH